MEKKPPATSRLAMMLQNPDLFAIDFDYHNTREALLEISSKIAEMNKAMADLEGMNNKFVTPRELQNVSKNVDEIGKKLESSAEESAGQLKDLRGYFTFQIKEINAKIDSTVSTLLSEISNSAVAAAPAETHEAAPRSADPLLRADIDNLKSRIDSIFEALQAPPPQQERQIKEEEAAFEVPKKVNMMSTSEPQIMQLQELPGTPKIQKGKTLVEMKVEDMRIQLDGLSKRLAVLEDKLLPVSDTVQSAKAKLDTFQQESMKTKTDLVIVKSNIDQLNTKVADLAEGAYHESTQIDVERPMNAMRQQIVEHFVMMENAFNEQILKLRAEISQLKGEQVEEHPEPIISVAAELAKKEPAEKQVFEQMRNEQQTEVKPKRKVKPVDASKMLESLVPADTPTVAEKVVVKAEPVKPKEYATAEVQTVENGGSLFKFDNFSNCTTIPSNMVVSVLVDSPPREVAAPAEEKVIEAPHVLSVEPTTMFEYSELASSDELTAEVAMLKEKIETQAKSIEDQAKAIEKLADTSAKEPQEAIVSSPKSPVSSVELRELKTQCRENTNAIEELRSAVDSLRSAPQQASARGLPNIPTPRSSTPNSPTSGQRPSLPVATGPTPSCPVTSGQRPSSPVTSGQRPNSPVASEPMPNSPIASVPIPTTGDSTGSGTARSQEQEEVTQAVGRQIVLSPVLFTPLNILPLPVYEIKDTSVQEPKKVSRVMIASDAIPVKSASTMRQRRRSDIGATRAPLSALTGEASPPSPQRRRSEVEAMQPLEPLVNETPIPSLQPLGEGDNGVKRAVPRFIPDTSSRHSRRQSDVTGGKGTSEDADLPRQSRHGHRRHQSEAHRDRKHIPRPASKLVEPEQTETETPQQPTEGIPIPSLSPQPDGIPVQPPGPEAENEGPKLPPEDALEEEQVVQMEYPHHMEEEGSESYDSQEALERMFDPKFKVIDGKIANHQDQLRILREAIVDLRTQVQVIKAHGENRGMPGLPQIPIESMYKEPEEKDKSDEVIRVLRRRFDAQTREFEEDLSQLRREVMELRERQAAVPQTITERIIEVQVPTPERAQSPPAATPVQQQPQTHESEKPDRTPHTPDDSPRLITVTPMSVPALRTPKRNRTPIVDPPQEPQPLPRVDPYHSPPKESPKTHVPPIQREPQPHSQALPPQTPSPADTTTPSDPAHKPIFQKIIPQQIEELKILSANDEIEARIVNLIVDVRTQLQLQTDQNTDRLTELSSKVDAYVTKDYIQKFFSKVKTVMSDLSTNVGTLKQALPERVTKTELQEALEELFHSLAPDNETSGGTSSYKCLLCGRPRTAISGMIKDRQVAQALGEPTESTATAGLSNPDRSVGRGTIIYGPDKQLYRGRGNFGRPTTAGIEGTRRGALPSLERKS